MVVFVFEAKEAIDGSDTMKNYMKEMKKSSVNYSIFVLEFLT